MDTKTAPFRYKKFVASPWVGEFGWELFCWQGFLRKKARLYEQKPTIFCRTGHEIIYQDFAGDIINYDPPVEMTDMWKNHGVDACKNDFKNLRYYYNVADYETVAHNSYPHFWWKFEDWIYLQEFVSYKKVTSKEGYDILLIVRDTNKCNTGFRNWPKADAARVAETLQTMGFSVACVGRLDSAYHILTTTDLRGLSLDALAHIMTNSRVIVGTQCGITHFATLCRLPQVVWQTKQEHTMRTQIKWNPFNTPVRTICSPNDDYWVKRKMWLPPDDVIISNITDLMSDKGDNI